MYMNRNGVNFSRKDVYDSEFLVELIGKWVKGHLELHKRSEYSGVPSSFIKSGESVDAANFRWEAMLQFIVDSLLGPEPDYLGDFEEGKIPSKVDEETGHINWNIEPSDTEAWEVYMDELKLYGERKARALELVGKYLMGMWV